MTSTRAALAWLAVLLAVGLTEFVLVMYALLGPARFEHAGLSILAGLGRIVPTDAVVVLPGGLAIRRVDSASLYQRAIDVQRDQGVTAAESLYTSAFAQTWPSELRSWLTHQAPHSRVQIAWQLGDGEDGIEVGWMTTDAFRWQGLEAADGLYRIEIQHGKIAAQDGLLTPTSQAWLLGGRSMADVGAWPTPEGRIALAGLVIALGIGARWLSRRPGARRVVVVAMLALIPAVAGLTFTLVDSSGSMLSTLLPDVALYRGHAALADAAERLGHSHTAAVQWAKAASHVRSYVEAREAAGGLARLGATDDVLISLCTQSGPGGPWGREVLVLAGIAC